MACYATWEQIHHIEKALRHMRLAGIPELSEPYQALFRQRGILLGEVGKIKPKMVAYIMKLAGFSPAEFKVFFDVETGWLVEGRARPGAPPVYKSVDADVAAAVMKREVTPELEERLLRVDEYVGE